MYINEIINQFVLFINNCDDNIIEITKKIEYNKKDYELADKIKNGFYQFIWEMVVENQICSRNDFLEPYSEGADFYGTSSRVVYPEKFATKTIKVEINNKLDHFSKKNITTKHLELIKFVSFINNEYFEKKPFDFVLCDDISGKKFIFKMSEVDFYLSYSE
jgi:hypothetical protein